MYPLEVKNKKEPETTHVRMVSLRDNDGIYDQTKFTFNELTKWSTNVDQKIKAFSFEWPYVSFTGLMPNHIYLVNAYD